ncbi:MAG: M20 family peptidase [Clostridia bacterium]|nr:M20 family peptidase [Clostridia bacterium]
MAVLLLALAAFAAVIIVRTLRFVPAPQEPVSPIPAEPDRERIVRNMQDMIRCRTVSGRDWSKVDEPEFEKFRALLKERYPNVHRAFTLERVGRTGLLYHMAGRSAAKPSVLMAHYDVVPVNEEGWTKPPFDAVIEDGCIWGRGTLDTKGTLLGVLEALEALLSDGFVPENDLYLSFSGEEEVDGASCPQIVERLRELGVTPALVVDEGGAVVSKVFPGVSAPCAVVGVAEKGFANFRFSLNTPGGHASTPPVKTALGQLSRAVVNIEKHPFAGRLTPPAAGLFDTLGRHSSFLYRMIFANLWCFRPVLNLYCRLSGGELNALMRTTVAVTRFEGSDAYNVLPPSASFGVNLRLLGGETVESAKAYLTSVIRNPEITCEVISGMNPSISSPAQGEGWDKLCAAIRRTWPEAIVSPYLMMACSDSRHYCSITDKVYRFTPMFLSKEERAMIHGNDERVPIDTLVKTVQFYIRLITTL